MAWDVIGDAQNEAFFNSNSVAFESNFSAAIVGTSTWTASAKAAVHSARRRAEAKKRSVASQVGGAHMSGLAYRYFQDAQGSVVAQTLGRAGQRVSHHGGAGVGALLTARNKLAKPALQDTQQHADRYFHRDVHSLVLPRAAASADVLHMPLHFKRARSAAAAAVQAKQAPHGGAMVAFDTHSLPGTAPVERSTAAADVVRARRDEAYLPLDVAGASQGDEATRGCKTPEELLMVSAPMGPAGAPAFGKFWRFPWESWETWKARRRRELRAYEGSTQDAHAVAAARYMFMGLALLVDALRPGGDAPAGPACSSGSMAWVGPLRGGLARAGGECTAPMQSFGASKTFLLALDDCLAADSASPQVALAAAGGLLASLAEATHRATPIHSSFEDTVLVIRCWCGRVQSAYGVVLARDGALPDVPKGWQPPSSAAGAVSAAAAALQSGNGDFRVYLDELLLSADVSAACDGNALGDAFDVVGWLEESHTLAMRSLHKALQGPQLSHDLFEGVVVLLQWTEGRLRLQGRSGAAAGLWLAWLEVSICHAVAPTAEEGVAKQLQAHLDSGGMFAVDDSVALSASGLPLWGGLASTLADAKATEVPARAASRSRWDKPSLTTQSSPVGVPPEVLEEVLLLQERCRPLVQHAVPRVAPLLPKLTAAYSSFAQHIHTHALDAVSSSQSAAIAPSGELAPGAAAAQGSHSDSTKAYIRTWNRLQGIDSDSDNDDEDGTQAGAALSAMESVSAKRARLGDWAQVQGPLAGHMHTLQTLTDDPCAARNTALALALCPPPCGKEELLRLLQLLATRTWQPLHEAWGERVPMLTPRQRLQCACLRTLLTASSSTARAESIWAVAQTLKSSDESVAALKQLAQESIASTQAQDQMPLWRAYLKGMLYLMLGQVQHRAGKSGRCDLRKWFSAAGKVAASAQANTTRGTLSEVSTHIIADAFCLLAQTGRALLCRLDSKEYLPFPQACRRLVALSGCQATAFYQQWEHETGLWTATSKHDLKMLDVDRAQARAVAVAAASIAEHCPVHLLGHRMCAPWAAPGKQSWKAAFKATISVSCSEDSPLAALCSCCVRVFCVASSLQKGATASGFACQLAASDTSEHARQDVMDVFEAQLRRDYASLAVDASAVEGNTEALWRCLCRPTRHSIAQGDGVQAGLLLHLLHTHPSLARALPVHGPMDKLLLVRRPLARRLHWMARNSKTTKSSSAARSALVLSIMSAPFDAFAWLLAPGLAVACGNATAADAQAFAQQATNVGFPQALLDSTQS